MSTLDGKNDGATLWIVPNNQADQISGERRHDRRYEVELELRWKLIRRKKVLFEGSGRTVDLSSGGILIETDRPLPVGLNLELSIAWPMTLQDGAPLQLVTSGRIVRTHGMRAAMRMMQHEFRTLGSASQQIPGPGARKQPPFRGSTPEGPEYGPTDRYRTRCTVTGI